MPSGAMPQMPVDPSAPVTMPPREASVLSAMLDAQADRIGDAPLMLFDDGEVWSYAQTRARARGTAAALAELGVRRGDRVLVWLPNGRLIFCLHLALSYLGAVFVPINLAWKGGMLEHVIANSGARLIICHAELVERLEHVGLADVETLIVAGGDGVSVPESLRRLDESVLSSEAEPPALDVEPWEPHGIFYTSGTTGPSKGVICPHLHTAVMAKVALRFLLPEDRFLISMPYFHLAGALVPFAVIATGASMAMLTRFRTSTFWDDVRATGSTVCYILDSIRTFLMKQPPRPDDADNPLRVAVQQPLSHDSVDFARRFGLTIYTQFDMTEILPVILSEPIGERGPPGPGYCGRAVPIWPPCEVRIVDEAEREVPRGATGQLILRCSLPWVITPGYWGMPEATAAAWRNGWFHTGDVFRQDDEGHFYFVDRMKDSIRRRGENISSSEVEAEALAHDGIELAAAIAVPSEHSEDEVMLVVKPKPGRTVDYRELFEFLSPRMPHYMLPRYIRVMEAMEMTATIKVRKDALRRDGVTPDTWDREAAGIVVRGQHIGGRAPA